MNNIMLLLKNAGCMGGKLDETLSYIYIVDIIFVARGTQLDGHKCLSAFRKKGFDITYLRLTQEGETKIMKRPFSCTSRHIISYAIL